MSARKKKGLKAAWRPWLVPVLGVAILGLGAALWTLLHPGGAPGESFAVPEGDFAEIIRNVAERRGSTGDRLREDDPIRKEEGVFVRTWRIAAPDRPSAVGAQSDLAAEASRQGVPVLELPSIGSDLARFRVDLEGEAFDIHVSVRPEIPPIATPEPAPPTPTPRPRPEPGARGRLAILLDDAGQSLDLMEAASGLPPEVGIAVLPFLPLSSETATTLHKAGHEIWLHLPMEPNGYPENKPGPGAVFISMSEDEVRTTVHAALNNVPHAVGMNNHMGSKATADLRLMTWIMQEIKGRGLAFIDSRTTVDTVAEDAARGQGVPCGRRHVFLDNTRSDEAVHRQFDEAVYRSLIEGECIAIGHLSPVTLRVLAREASTFEERGVTLVRPTDLLR